MDNFWVKAFRPLNLTVDGIGPFQEQPFSMTFLDREGEPCNLYMMISENGRGKTTLLELMACLMEMLALQEPIRLGFEDLDNGAGRAQWDVLATLVRDGREETVVLSLGAGRDDPWALRPWGAGELEKFGASQRCQLGYRRHASGRLELVGTKNDVTADLLAAVRVHSGSAPLGFEDDPMSLPSLLYFSAYRDISRVSDDDRGIMQPHDWGYHPVHRFGKESAGWRDSLDNLLVWLKWLDEKRFDQAVKLINHRVFSGGQKYLKGVRKQPPEAVVMNGKFTHRLDRLSSGEKSLVQLYLRAGIHMTTNSILLVDEMDVHLHTKLQHRTLNMLKQMAKDHEGLTIIFTSHARELIPAFAHTVRESGLRKSGHIIEEGLG